MRRFPPPWTIEPLDGGSLASKKRAEICRDYQLAFAFWLLMFTLKAIGLILIIAIGIASLFAKRLR
jgi:hypothetical protein